MLLGLLMVGCGREENQTDVEGSEYFLDPLVPSETSKEGSAVIIHIEGKAKAKIPSLLNDSVMNDLVIDWKLVNSQKPLPVGTVIETEENSKAVLLLTNGTTVMTNSNTKFEIDSFHQEDFQDNEELIGNMDDEISTSKIKLNLELGELLVDVKKLSKDSRLFIHSSYGTCGIRGTQFGISSFGNEGTLEVNEGSVDFWDGKTKPVKVSIGQKMSLSNIAKTDSESMSSDRKKNLADSFSLISEKTKSFSIKEIHQAYRFGNEFSVESFEEANWHKGKKFDRGTGFLYLQTNEWGGTIHLLFKDERIRKGVAPIQAKLLLKIHNGKAAVSRNIGKIYIDDILIGTVPRTSQKDLGQWVEIKLDSPKIVPQENYFKLVIKPGGPDLLTILKNKSSKPKLFLVY